jgi:hypothetical protein
MKKEDITKDTINFLNEMISLWTQATNEEKLNKLKEFKKELEEEESKQFTK